VTDHPPGAPVADLLTSWLLHLRAERKSEQTINSHGDGSVASWRGVRAPGRSRDGRPCGRAGLDGSRWCGP